MGTTQRIIPGVTGEPNWSNLSNAITALVNTVERELQVADQASAAKEKEETAPSTENKIALKRIEGAQAKLNVRKDGHFRSTLRNLIRTGGGRSNIVKGRSSSLGKAGVRTSRRISGFILNAYNNGLGTALTSIGFGAITGKTLNQVIDFLLVYFADVASGMDDVAANMASCQIFEILSQGVNTIEELEEKMNALVDGPGLTELICTFYGIYLFEHLSERFQEKITQLKGENISRETFAMIKEDIIGQVRILSQDRQLSTIDWKGNKGNDIQETIFDSIIQLFE